MKLNQLETPAGTGGTVKLDEEQFATLVELLTPGYELAMAMKAEREAQPAAAPDETHDVTEGQTG